MAAAFAAAPVLTSVLIASTVATVALTTVSTIQQAKAAKRQRAAEQQREKQLTIQGLQQANEIRREQLEALAAANVAAAAGGIDPFTGAPAKTKERIDARTNRQLRTARLESGFGIAASQSTQAQLKIQGRAAFFGGAVSSFGAVGGAAGGLGRF